MALFGNLGKGYTKTDGKNFFTSVSHVLSYIPSFGFLAPLLMPATLIAGGIGTVVDAGKWLLKGKFLSALTTLFAGGAETVVNSISGGFGVTAVKLGSGLGTGESLGTHARKAIEMGMGGLSGLVGAKPTVLSSYTAGIGSINSGAVATNGPGKWMSQAAASRGEDANAAYARLQSGQPEHLAALQSAQQTGYSHGM